MRRESAIVGKKIWVPLNYNKPYGQRERGTIRGFSRCSKLVIEFDTHEWDMIPLRLVFLTEK